MRPFPLAAFAIINLLPSANAIWPFRQKRFVAEALIDAGPLGLEAMTGRVVAVGDWNGDQKLTFHSLGGSLLMISRLDLFTLSEDSKTLQIHLWDRGELSLRS
jgi:integrin alpha FG-GAP repeat containing protein 1